MILGGPPEATVVPLSRLTSLTGCLCTSSPQGLLQFEVKGGGAGGGAGGGGGEGGRLRHPSMQSCPVHTKRECEQERDNQQVRR